ncbi:MAG: antitoxin [Actinobacteria bacterium HGW-Actinobacteria-2]|jgi:hypothetical protein|nr:MAG: antitoxin [Actinobacteria bacterium HGW-Actinobacteria-2]
MDIVEQIKDAVEGHETEVKQGIDAVGDFIDSQTGGQYTAQVDQAQDFLKGQVGGDSQ